MRIVVEGWNSAGASLPRGARREMTARKKAAAHLGVAENVLSVEREARGGRMCWVATPLPTLHMKHKPQALGDRAP